jgi:hypothetical protein
MTRVLISQWQPWARLSISLGDRVQQIQQVHGEACIKGSDGTALYGPDTWSRFKVWPYKGKSNDDFERACKNSGLKVQTWNFPYLQYPSGSANAILESNARWNPQDVFIDAEGSYVGNYPYNTGPFLRGLGVVTVRYWLQSYRVPSYHPEVLWDKWLHYKDPNGKYIIHGLAPQAYPIGTQDFASDFKRMVDDYEKVLVRVGREDMPWLVTLPTFTEHNWYPTVTAMIEGVDYLKARLGSRLVGFNFWRQAFLFDPLYIPILTYIGTLYEEEEETTEPVPEPQPPSNGIIARVKIVATPYLNIRKEASSDSKDIGELYPDSIVPVVERNGDWLRIGEGWIHKGYVQEVQ